MAKHIRRLEQIKERCVLNEKGCWIWTGYCHRSIKKNSKPYAFIGYKGKVIYGHRLIFLLKGHIFLPKQVVCHKCDETRCLNPDHLFLGTQKDNVRDMYNKGRNNPQFLEICRRGHLRSGENLKTRLKKDGKVERLCIACKRINEKNRTRVKLRGVLLKRSQSHP